MATNFRFVTPALLRRRRFPGSPSPAGSIIGLPAALTRCQQTRHASADNIAPKSATFANLRAAFMSAYKVTTKFVKENPLLLKIGSASATIMVVGVVASGVNWVAIQRHQHAVKDLKNEFGKLSNDFGALENKVDKLENKFDYKIGALEMQVDNKIGALENQVDKLEVKLERDRLEAQAQRAKMQEDLTKMNRKIDHVVELVTPLIPRA